MKRLIATFSLLLTMIAGASAQNDAMYVYRNDGKFNAFLKSDIDSVVYSHLDIDSVYHKEWQMQVVYTPDSTYRIPVAAIDSVSFHAPKTEYQEDVILISSKWSQYLVNIEDNYITLAPDIPDDLLPKKNEIIYTTISDNDLGKGFAGRVENVVKDGNYIVECSDVKLTDVFKTLVCAGKSVSVSSNSAKVKSFSSEIQGDIVYFNFPEFTVGVTPISLNVKPTITATYSVCIIDGKQTSANYSVFQSYECSANLDCNIEGEYKPEPYLIPMPTIPFGATGFYAQFSLGWFFEASAGAVISGSQRFTLSNVTDITYSDDMVYYNDNGGWKSELQDPEFSVNGQFTMTAGFAGRFTFNWVNDKLASVGVTAKIGPQIDVNLKLSSDGLINKSMYSALKDSQLKLNAYYSIQAGYRFAGQAYKDFFRPIELTLPFNSWYLLPEFSSLSWEKEEGSQGGRLGGNIYRNLLMPIQVGWALYDNNDNIYQTKYFPGNYRKLENWQWEGMGYQFGDLPWGARYTAYPLIKILGQEMIADESVDVVVDPCVKTGDVSNITSTTATVSGYAEGLTYASTSQKGICYSTNQESENWSVISSGNSDGSFSVELTGLKRDTRYYYCSYVCLDGEYTYGELKSFYTEQGVHSCPDNNHPHAIDLGLPSGTKWACCNVGASSPEQYGGYYAWGETSEKSVYTEANYKYFNGADTNGDGRIDRNFSVVNIGSDIAGTQYDVAHVRMGGSWRMPSYEQILELIDNCTRTWTQQNGVKGILVTGPSGGQIFLPAAGHPWDDNLKGEGSNGDYWSSSLTPDSDTFAYGLYFDSGGWLWSNYGNYRAVGQSVRAVCP